MSIDIPRLKLKAGVVQVAWEPPPFAVGQIKTSAHVTEGNTVLVGHLRGAAGNVFDHLDQLKPGDEVTAVSRGLPYRFVVSQIFTGSNTDSTPVDPVPEEASRLTLMTCAGVWNPFTHDYSQRLWVIAEPPERAAETIVRVAAAATAQATLDAAATATAFALIPTPEPTPTPYVGEPSLAGGLGNTRSDVGRALGAPKGETAGKLVVFRQPSSEVRVGFTPDPPRESFLVEVPSAPLAFEAAVRESRRFFPTDAEPRADAPEGNAEFVVERFSSPSLAAALGNGDFSVIYVRDRQARITSIILGLGDDYSALIEQSRA
jgi:LPXTG-site transpeptidase (sortase) family protein